MKIKIFCLLFIFYCFNILADNYEVFLRISGAFSENIFFSREITIENFHNCSRCPFTYSFLFSQESFDNFFWGIDNRFSLKWNLFLGDKENLFLKAGPGIGFATSYNIFSFSPDIYFKLYYLNFFIFADTSFYTDGLFNKNGAGFKFKLWEILFEICINNIIISDYKYLFFKLRCGIGAGYEF